MSKLHFASGSLKQYLNITHDEQLESEATPAEDIEGKLYQFIPADYTKSSITFDETIEADAITFKPLGEKMAAYVRPSGKYIASLTGGAKGKGKAKGKTDVEAVEVNLSDDSENAVVFEVYKVSRYNTVLSFADKKATWSTPGFREYHRRMQLFILLFIEGGSYVHVSHHSSGPSVAEHAGR
jgi:histone acetyltransferase 1